MFEWTQDDRQQWFFHLQKDYSYTHLYTDRHITSVFICKLLIIILIQDHIIIMIPPIHIPFLYTAEQNNPRWEWETTIDDRQDIILTSELIICIISMLCTNLFIYIPRCKFSYQSSPTVSTCLHVEYMLSN